MRRWGAVVIEGSKGDAACKGKTGRVASLAKSANAPPRSGATTSDRNLLPKGLIAFPGSGITDNLVDKAVALGIPVQRCAA